ncbi:hypothetical protein BKA63DRAFT_475099 [Paraphoma chrysanthemicola]|nr:hypothetical protein BKA63DRAFT_475099 [Paraphoma chrysanthemicola]
MAIDGPYEHAIQKGTTLLHLLDTNHNRDNSIKQSRNVSKSAFTSPQDLELHGFKGEVTHTCIDNTTLAPLAPTRHDLGLNHTMVCDGGNNVMVKHTHLENRLVDGVQYSATQATHIQICNPTEGVLIAHSNHSAEFMAAFNDPPVPITNITPLHYWSDIAWLQWLIASDHTRTNMSVSTPTKSETVIPPIKFVFRLNIHHPPTYVILNKIAAKQSRNTYDVWPGVTFNVESEEGRAILGTPHGAGVAWMLIQRRTELGVCGRRINRVTMFWAEGDGVMWKWPSLLFWIE